MGSSTEITFWAVGYCSPPSPRTPFTYIMYNMTIHSYAKGFLGPLGRDFKINGGGGGGGGNNVK